MTLTEQIEIFKKLGYELTPPITEKNIFDVYQDIYQQEEKDRIENFFDNPDGLYISKINFHSLYYQLGRWHPDIGKYTTDNCYTWQVDCFDGDFKNVFIEFTKRMGVISRGELIFSEVFVEGFIDDYVRTLYFTVNGVKKIWQITLSTVYDFVYRFSSLCLECKTKGQYTVYSDGGLEFVFDWATKDELDMFNEVTNLNRTWLQGSPYFV